MMAEVYFQHQFNHYSYRPDLYAYSWQPPQSMQCASAVQAAEPIPTFIAKGILSGIATAFGAWMFHEIMNA
jgi:hypothetical protein